MLKRRIGLPVLPVVGALLLGASAAAQDAVKQPLPLRDVVLFSSGVGYFQRVGRIDGPAAVPLTFRAEQVNDILKSLVLFDPQGAVRPATYETDAPDAGRVGKHRFSLEGGQTLGALLRQFQGAQVRLDLGTEPAVEGRIVSVSMRQVAAAPQGLVTTEVVNVLTAAGLKAVVLERVQEVKLLDERLDRELREALEAAATGLDDQRKAVELHFAGSGAREVRAGYLTEMPVWKTSYRLVLEKEQKPYLQGWAIVENTTDEDWANVSLSLVSGRPVSFLQDLYQPLYIPRPVVAAQVIGSPVPQTYGEVLTEGGLPLAAGEAQNGAVVAGTPAQVDAYRRKMAQRSLARGERAPAGPAAGLRFGFGGGFGAPALREELKDAENRRSRLAVSAEQLAKSAAAEARGTERGDLFEYAIEQPVTLAKGQAALVPIIGGTIDGNRLSIYDPSSDAKHALNGFRLKNSTGMHLSGGPITVFRDGVYAGDAQVGNVQPGEDRLLSYAVDLDLVVGREEPKSHQETLDVSAKSGVLQVTRKEQREQVYTFRNKGDEAKTVLVEQPIEPEFKLVEPEKPAEKTADRYRFRVAVPAGKTVSLKVVTDRPLMEKVALYDMDLNVVSAWAQNARVSEKLRGALKELAARRRKITDLQAQRAALEAELKSIGEDQARIRENMRQLDRNSALYQQYVKKLTDQETRLERLREEVARLRDAEARTQKDLRQFVDTLTAE